MIFRLHLPGSMFHTTLADYSKHSEGKVCKTNRQTSSLQLTQVARPTITLCAGEKTASSGWKGKSQVAALRQSMVDSMTNSAGVPAGLDARSPQLLHYEVAHGVESQYGVQCP
eukprot:1578326-Amphidinium_carterae.1